MVTSVFFNNYKASNEQELLTDLTVETIRVFGEDMYYIIRTLNNFDKLNQTSDIDTYSQVYPIEVYIENVNGFQGDRDFMSKFAGLEIRDQVTFSVAQRTFNLLIGQDAGFFRPREGDLFYFPLNQKCFQIKYVDKFEMYYQLGAVYTWKMTCELFEYSNETFNTGIPEIDSLQLNFSFNIFDYLIDDTNGTPITFENGNYWVVDSYQLQIIDPIADNDSIRQEANNYIDWTELDPFTDFTNDGNQI